MHNSSLVAVAQYFWRIRTSVLYGNQKKCNTEAVNDYPPIRFEIRFEQKFPIVGLYFWTLPVETLWNLCPVEKLFGMRMAGLCQFHWRTCLFIYLLIYLLTHLLTYLLIYFICTQNCSTDLALRPLHRCLHGVQQQTRIHAGYRRVKLENLLLSLTVNTKHSQCPVALGSCFFRFQ